MIITYTSISSSSLEQPLIIFHVEIVQEKFYQNWNLTRSFPVSLWVFADFWRSFVNDTRERNIKHFIVRRMHAVAFSDHSPFSPQQTIKCRKQKRGNRDACAMVSKVILFNSSLLCCVSRLCLARAKPWFREPQSCAQYSINRTLKVFIYCWHSSLLSFWSHFHFYTTKGLKYRLLLFLN